MIKLRAENLRAATLLAELINKSKKGVTHYDACVFINQKKRCLKTYTTPQKHDNYDTIFQYLLENNLVHREGDGGMKSTYFKVAKEKPNKNSKPTIELPKGFVIKAENHHLLTAIGHDLQDMGYKVGCLDNTYKDDVLSFDKKAHSSLEEFNNTFLPSEDKFRELLIDAIEYPKEFKEFTLPQQYNEALDFAKQQLESKYWSKIVKLDSLTVVNHHIQKVIINKTPISFSEFAKIQKTLEQLEGIDGNISVEILNVANCELDNDSLKNIFDEISKK